MNERTIQNHQNIVLQFVAISSNTKNVMELGRELTENGCDELTDGGFWVLDFANGVEFYSPKFRESLGYEGEHDFPSVPSSWQDCLSKNQLDLVMANYHEHLNSGGNHPYYQNVTYVKKYGNALYVNCSGSLIKNKKGDPLFMIGSHKIIDDAGIQ